MTNYSYNLHGIEELITAPPDYKYYANPGDVIIMQQPITNYETYVHSRRTTQFHETCRHSKGCGEAQ